MRVHHVCQLLNGTESQTRALGTRAQKFSPDLRMNVAEALLIDAFVEELIRGAYAYYLHVLQ